MTAPALTTFASGLSQVSGDNLNTFMQTCNTVAELRGFIGTAGVQVYMRGFTAINDGGQGQFYWNVSGTGPDDSGITSIVPSGSTVGCWSRIASVFPGTVTAYSFIPTSSTAPSSGMYLYSSGIVGISANSAPAAIFAGTSGAVNFLEIANRLTGNDPFIQAVGSDSNIGILLASKGTRGIGFYTNTVSLQFSVSHTASAANYIEASGGALGSPAVTTLTASGTSTDIDINIVPKGAGQVRLPTTANGAIATAMSNVGPTGSHTTVQEWFTVKNASGTVRYIPGF